MSKPKYDIITIGGATRDFFVYTNKGTVIDNKKNLIQSKLLAFEYGAKLYADKLYSFLGGGACNTAIGFSRLKLKTAIRVCVNNKEEGDWIKSVLKKEKVDTSLVENNNKESSGVSFIVINENMKNKEHVAFSYRGANKYLKISKKDKFNTNWIYLSSFSGENWAVQLKNIAYIVKNSNIKLGFNPGSLQIESGINKLKDILKITEVFIVNRDEAIELLLSKHHYNHAPHIEELLKGLHQYCPKIVIITDGSNGAYAYDGEKIYFYRGKKVKVVDTTGAGDGFSAGFIGELIKTHDITRALAMGVRNGASVATKMGAQAGLLRR